MWIFRRVKNELKWWLYSKWIHKYDDFSNFVLYHPRVITNLELNEAAKVIDYDVQFFSPCSLNETNCGWNFGTVIPKIRFVYMVLDERFNKE